jgi:hypothetical protein
LHRDSPRPCRPAATGVHPRTNPIVYPAPRTCVHEDRTGRREERLMFNHRLTCATGIDWEDVGIGAGGLPGASLIALGDALLLVQRRGARRSRPLSPASRTGVRRWHTQMLSSRASVEGADDIAQACAPPTRHHDERARRSPWRRPGPSARPPARRSPPRPRQSCASAYGCPHRARSLTPSTSTSTVWTSGGHGLLRALPRS